MFLDDENTVEETTSTPAGQVPQMNFNFMISCVIDPAHPEKPVCKLKYRPKESEDTEEEEIIEDSDEKDLEDDDEENGKGTKKPEKKKHKKSKSKSHDEDEDDIDDEDDFDDDENPVLRCVAEAFDHDDEDE